MKAGIPVAPISVAYSQSEDIRQLQSCSVTADPGCRFAQDENVVRQRFRSQQSLGHPRGDCRGNQEGRVDRILAQMICVDQGRALRAPFISAVPGNAVAKSPIHLWLCQKTERC